MVSCLTSIVSVRMLDRYSPPIRWKHLLIGAACFLLVTIAALPTLSQEESIDTLKQQQQYLDQQKKAVQQERDRVQKLENNAQTQLKGTRKHIQATTAQIQTTESKIQSASQALKKLESALSNSEKTYWKSQSATVSRLRFLQRQQGSYGWAVLLQSQGLNDFLDRRYQLKRVYQHDRTLLSNLKSDADRLNRQREQVERQRNEIDLLKQELMAQKSQYEQQADYQKQVVERLKSDKRALEAAQTQLEKDSKGIGNLIQTKVAEMQRRLAEEARERAKRGEAVAIVLGTGQFTIPSVGEITSSFGWRTHPILGYQKFHSGMDFGADYGSPIMAADRGVVVFAGWYGGYGNTVIVDHGNGLSTLYAHSEELYVEEGQSVQRGQAIAAVGSTGLSTGPHLHFEVRRDGEPIDPAEFL
jgi:murein DD-endopeptidase MepM/ murein hydrolase activator NlpD